jgi:cytochrome c-type biogenesis protein CcmH/NrfG
MVGCDATFRSEADRWFTSAVEAEDTRDRTAARLHAQRAVHSDPQHTGALALLGLCQIRDGDRHSGRVSQHLAAQLAPDDPNVLHFVGVGSWECEDGHQAIETLSRAVELESPHPSSVPVLAQILELSNRTAEAQTLLDRFDRFDPASQLLRARLLDSGARASPRMLTDRPNCQRRARFMRSARWRSSGNEAPGSRSPSLTRSPAGPPPADRCRPVDNLCTADDDRCLA